MQRVSLALALKGIPMTYSVVWLNERVVDGNDLDFTVLDAVLGSALTVPWAQVAVTGIWSCTYALRKTIRPILPKPLIPHCYGCMSMWFHILTSDSTVPHLLPERTLVTILAALLVFRGGVVKGG